MSRHFSFFKLKKALRHLMPVLSGILITSCHHLDLEEQTDSFADTSLKSFYRQAVSSGISKEIPDTSEFILKITDSSGGTVLETIYGERPENIVVPAGVNTFAIFSYLFTDPVFGHPLYGDVKEVEVKSGERFKIDFDCRQLTCGVRIHCSEQFVTTYPDGLVTIRWSNEDNEKTSIPYPYDETAPVHFKPGEILVYFDKKGDGCDMELLTGRVLSSAEMLNVNVTVSTQSGSGKFSISVDTLTECYEETIDYGIGGDGSDVYHAISISRISQFEGDSLWFTGFVTGCFKNSKYFPGDTSATSNVAISASSGETDPGLAVPIGFTSGSKLSDIRQYLGKRVYVCGTVETYFKRMGIKKMKALRIITAD